MTKGNNKNRKLILIGLISIFVFTSVIVVLSSTTYLSCYVMSVGVKQGYVDKQISLLPEHIQNAVSHGLMSIEDMNPSPEFIQDAGYNYCLSFAPGLPESINVEFE